MPILDIFWTILWLFLFFIWIWLLISIFADVFRSRMSGWSKAIWVVVLIVLPILGCLVYLIFNGDDMAERSATSAMLDEQAQREYIRSVAGSPGSSTASELAQLAQLRDQGVISEDEFQAQKAKLLA